MRHPIPRLFAIATALAVLGGGRLHAAPKDGPDLNGSWKLVLLQLNPAPLFLVGVKEADGKLAAEVKDAGRLGAQLKLGKVERRGDKVAVSFDLGPNTFTFRGTPSKDGGKITGALSDRGRVIPARLERTDEAQVTQAAPDQVRFTKFLSAMRNQDPQAKLKGLAAVLGDGPSGPEDSPVVAEYLKAAVAAGQPEGDVRRKLERWLEVSRPYGDAWTAEVYSQALGLLNGKKDYAALALDLAQKADKDVAGAEAEPRARVAELLAAAAKLAGKDDLAKESGARSKQLSFEAARDAEKALPADATDELKARAVARLATTAREAGKMDIAKDAEARSAKLEAQLDEEYHRKVPPFKPESFAGRKDPKADRVVVFEIFTGAQCPPCVGADVAFDALLETYKPTELIGLQYHLHIPGPDPLTNPATLARQKYYASEFQGTPTTFFNGKRDGGSGGFMNKQGPVPGAEEKYGEYRGVITPLLNKEKQATIDLAAKRIGDEVRITASAETKEKAAKPVLRLALVEDQVKYVGGNKLRFHHRVVRDMPGGPEGKPLANGRVQVEQTVKLDELRRSLQQYLDDFGSFPNPLPPIALKGLSVVAFVQDDADHKILHAVTVPVDEPKKAEANP
jgi:hypothetical protein